MVLAGLRTGFTHHLPLRIDGIRIAKSVTMQRPEVGHVAILPKDSMGHIPRGVENRAKIDAKRGNWRTMPTAWELKMEIPAHGNPCSGWKKRANKSNAGFALLKNTKGVWLDHL